MVHKRLQSKKQPKGQSIGCMNCGGVVRRLIDDITEPRQPPAGPSTVLEAKQWPRGCITGHASRHTKITHPGHRHLPDPGHSAVWCRAAAAHTFIKMGLNIADWILFCTQLPIKECGQASELRIRFIVEN